ncbi:MAG: hypothetical protein EPO11_06985, partial [Gammaproteobacteria bacterium]
YHSILIGLMILIALMIVAISVVLYQLFNKPLPAFYAATPNGQRMTLAPNADPNLMPDTLLTWASKAAIAAYTFDFYNYNTQVAAVKPYFTDSGWQDYQRSVKDLLDTIVARQLFVSGVVAGTPVISNQGPLPGKDYAWRIQIPFLVTYQSANTTNKRNFIVIINIVRVPTNVNPQAIGIDQFIMI